MADLSTLIAGYKRDLTDVARASAGELSARVVTRTPVDTGKLRRSWEPSKPARSIVAGDIFEFINRQPYARRIEYGWSRQAPGGMLRVSVAEWQSIVSRVVAQVR